MKKRFRDLFTLLTSAEKQSTGAGFEHAPSGTPSSALPVELIIILYSSEQVFEKVNLEVILIYRSPKLGWVKLRLILRREENRRTRRKTLEARGRPSYSESTRGSTPDGHPSGY